MIKAEDYFNNDEMRIDVFKAKYLTSPNQGVDECFNNIANEIASVSCETDSDKCAKEWGKEMLDGIWRPGGSIISSINNKSKKISTFNCTTLVIKEDSLESIYDTRKEAAIMAAHRQGLGVEFSKLRPAGSYVNNSAEVSEGVINWMLSFNRLADEVGQKGRKPAILGSLKIEHPDILQFITIKSDNETLKNMNISVQISDEFMECLSDNGKWDMKFGTEDGTEFTKTKKAEDIFNLICKQSHTYAEPGIQFIDLMRRFSIQEALGYEITSTNACSEKPLTDRGVCCLASLNMQYIPSITSTEFHKIIEFYVYNMVRFMDNVVQYEIDNSYKSPIKEQLDTVKNLREIGLGVTNVNQWLYDNELAYDSDEAGDTLEYFFKYYQYYAFKASCKLAIERGPCNAWLNQKNNDKLKTTEFLDNLFEEFPDLEKLYYDTGIRNAALLSIAPTGSISFTFPEDCLSAGIEPLTGYAFWRRTRAISKGEYDYYFMFPSSIKNIVVKNIKKAGNDIDLEKISNLPSSVLDNDGKIGMSVISIINKYTNVELLKPATEIDPYKKVVLMGKVQKWVDAAISVTYNLPEDFTPEGISKLYKMAYKHKLKALSVYREGSREGILIFDDPLTHKAKYDDTPNVICKERPDSIMYHCAPKRPSEINCNIHHCSVKGEQWIVLIGLQNSQPYEIFAGKKNEDFNLSKNITSGTISKKKRTYILKVPYRSSYIEYVGITDLFMNEEYKALTRMISLALRHGVYNDFITSQLKKSSDFVGDFMAVVSRVLNKYSSTQYRESSESDICPNCSEKMVNEGGCLKCVACGYSKCE